MGLIAAVSSTYDAFNRFFDCLPLAVRLILYASAGISVLFGVLKLFFD